MRVINPNAHKDFDALSDAVFLAGPCPRGNGVVDWREEAIDLFRKHGFTGDIINPTNNSFDDADYLKQLDWEHRGLCLSSVILFWIPRTEENPAFTTNVEFGEWMSNDGVVLGFPIGSMKNRYLGARFQQTGREVHYTLEDAVLATIELIKNRHKSFGGNTFFTSDTHFSQKRTLKLSYRPFRSVEEMDLQLISNWNKRLNSQSTIFHLGDFGNFDVLSLLNFKKMYLVLGNYEKEDDYYKTLKDDRVQIGDSFIMNLKGIKFFLCHEPLYSVLNNGINFHLYGHIHRLQMVKKNGINVGVDGNRFNPMTVKELEFLYGGVTRYFDGNVFTEYCR